MAQYRMLISYEDPTAPDASDYVVNTFYLDTDALSGADDPGALAQDAADLFATYRPLPDGMSRIRCRAYDMSDPEPRLPAGEGLATDVSSGSSGPREVALCLSYYADRNLPRRRGRMYIGYWLAGAMQTRPSTGTQADLQALAAGISGLGGVNVQWVQYSPTTGEFHNVTHWWVDNEWDTVRSRGLEATTRIQGDVSG